MSLFNLIVCIFFSLEYLRMGLVTIHPAAINICTFSLSLLLIYMCGVKYRKNITILVVAILATFFAALLNGLRIGFLDSYSITYTVFKSVELLAILSFVSRIDLNKFTDILKNIINTYIFINAVLFLYYIYFFLLGNGVDSRPIVYWPYRFAGLCGEPAQFAQHAVFIIFSILLVKKFCPAYKYKLKLAMVIIWAFLSFSNSILLLLFFMAVFYFLFMDIKKIAIKIGAVISAIPLTISFLSKVNTRLDIDYEAIGRIFANFHQLSELVPLESLKFNPITQGNPLTIRIFEFIYSISLINQPIAQGYGSRLAYAHYIGLIDGNTEINMYGITQIGFELGVIPMSLFIGFMCYYLFLNAKHFNNTSKLLCVSVFYMIFIMNGFNFRIVWFFLFVTFTYKEWFIENYYFRTKLSKE